MSAIEKRGFTREEAAEYTGLSFWKIRDAVRDGLLPAKKHGTTTIVLREDLDAYMDSLEPA